MNMSEDDFSLGDFVNELSNSDDFTLGFSDSTNTDDSQLSDIQYTNSDKEEVIHIYDLLVKDKSPKEKFKEFFLTNVNIFEVAGKKPFEYLTKNEYDTFCNNVDKWVAIANIIWLRNDKEKILLLNDALEELKNIFKYEKLTKDYSNVIKRNLRNELARFIYSKFKKDKTLDIAEILEAMDYAISIKYTNDRESAGKAVTSIVKQLKEKYDFKIESYEDSFLQLISKKDKIDLLNTDQTKQKLFKEFKPFAQINAQVLLQELPSDEALYEEMNTLLSENNILIPNTDFFIMDFLEPEIERQIGHYDFSVPLNTEYYYYLKGTALNIYQLTEDQWREITLIRGISAEASTTVAFIMGYKKESSIRGIASMIKENPQAASTRILSGDLETYFTHVGRNNLAKKISIIKEKFSSNNDELISQIVNLLSPIVDEMPEIEKKENSFNSLLENKADIQELIAFILNNKSNESLINEIITDSLTTEKLKAYFATKTRKITYKKFLLNLLNELLFETDIIQYKFIFIEVAEKVYQELISMNDFITFVKVYCSIIENAENKGIITLDDLPGYSDSCLNMKELFNKESKLINPKKEKKSFFKPRNKGI